MSYDDFQQVQEERAKQHRTTEKIFLKLKKEGDIPSTIPSTTSSSKHPDYPTTPLNSITSIKTKRTRDDSHQSTRKSKRQRIHSPKKTKK